MSSLGQTCPMCGAVVATTTGTCAACGEQIRTRVDRRTWPLIVRLSLWGLRTRTTARAFVWICILGALGSACYGFVYSRFFVIGVLWAFGAIAYYFPLRWVDRNNGWPS